MINCREYAIKLITIKDRTQKELHKKLCEKGYSEDEICEQIEFLKEYGYINDERFAQKYINDCVNLKKWGNARIKIELLKKGIDKEIIENLLYDDEKSILESEFNRKFANADLSNMKERQRIYGYFLRRGFKSSLVQGVINSMSSFKDVYFDEDI